MFLDLGKLDAEQDDTGLPIETAKGSMTLTVTNTTSVAWGDFYFGISFSNAIFDPNETPTWDHGDGLAWELSASNTVSMALAFIF